MISFSTHLNGMDPNTGYGYAGQHIVRVLGRLQDKVPFNSPDCSVLLNYTQPSEYHKYKDQYSIGYTCWESTVLKPGWKKMMSYMDEIWTPSPLVATWFKNSGVEPPIYVVEHGVEHMWMPVLRKPGAGSNRPLKFLHVGEPAPRKSGQMVVDVFTELFGNNKDYQLTIKADGYNTTRSNPVSGVLGPPNDFYSNIKLITDRLEIGELLRLYQSHDVLVYPSFGEGFGFIPLQAMATGMPVILNTSWCPYERFSVGLEIEDFLAISPWQEMHPGSMYHPSRQSLRKQMQEVACNFEYYAKKAFFLAPKVHQEYD